MRLFVRRRQVLLFIVAILLPCAVLLALSLRIMSQERELAEKRLVEDRHRLASQVRNELLTRLERIKLQEVSALAHDGANGAGGYANPEVVLLAAVQDQSMVFPWQAGGAGPESAGSPEYAQKIREGERFELAEKQFGRAVNMYRRAVDAARDPSGRAYARLLLARALLKSGDTEEPAAQYRKILDLPSTACDEQGLPWSLYAAGRLLEAGKEHRAVLERVAAELKVQRLRSPEATYALRDLTEKLARKPDASVRAEAGKLKEQVSGHIRSAEQALALQKDFPNLGLLRASAARRPEPLWVPYGRDPWLVSLAPALAGQPPLVVAVAAERMSAGFAPQRLSFLGGRDAGESLGENLPGVNVAFLSNAATFQTGKLQRWFVLVAVLLVLTATLFGAYLLLRDVRREVGLAQVRSQFVSSVSHELKTPLTAIRMFAEMLRMGRSANAAAQQEYLDIIVNESERLTRLLNNVLDFSKIEQGKKTYHFQPISLAETVQATARALEYPLQQQGFRLNLELQEDLPSMSADRDALEQAILNLVTNAVKYSGKSRDVAIRLISRNGDAIIQVKDQGIGIPAEEQQRIFQNFYRVPSRENASIPGTGLGLAVVTHIVKGHGGRVELESTPGMGSTFSICLPWAGRTS